MADSAVEQIINAVRTVLLTVPGIGEVSRDGIDALRVTKFPAVVIGIETDSPDHMLNDQINRTLDISVTCWIKTEKDTSKTLEAFKGEVKKKMALDPQFGLTDLIDSLEGSSSGNFPMNEELTEAGEVIRYQFRYRTSRTDPFVLIG